MYIYRLVAAVAALLVLPVFCVRAADDGRWFPLQKMPAEVIVTGNYHDFDTVVSPDGQSIQPGFGPEFMLAQSAAGLAALAVNEGRGDQMVWLGTGNEDYEDWFVRQQKRCGFKTRRIENPWDVVSHFMAKGLVKGYILYAYDYSNGEINAHRPGMDLSVNVATSLAPFLEAVIVEEGQEARAKKLGLTMLLDARGKTQAWCFEQYKDQFNRTILFTQDPRKPHLRAMSIAQRAFMFYGYDAPAEQAMEWLTPPAPIMGWNGGGEDVTTKMSSIYGHFQTATDWCLNMPVLMAGSEDNAAAYKNPYDPGRIDWNEKRATQSFVVTDGDNVQWYLGGFGRSQGPNWWTSPDHGAIPYGWSCCFAHLRQLCPVAMDYYYETQMPADSFIEWGGGYFYPELFGSKRSNAEELMAEHARRTWVNMQQSGTNMIGFNFFDLESAQTRRACEIYAQEMDGLLGILAFQYYPYEGGAGKVFWVKNKQGIEIPVVTARYAIWENCNDRPRCGTPAKIAREIDQTAKEAFANGEQAIAWTITHAWSFFTQADGTDEAAENMSQAGAEDNGGIRGYSPVVWCARRLDPKVHNIAPPEEMLWRIRMRHNPDQTKQLLNLH